MREGVRWRGIAVFLVLAFGLAWALEILLRPAGVNLLTRSALAMFAPAVAAYLVRGPLLREGFRDTGASFNFTKWRFYAIAYAISPAALAVGFCLALLLGEQHWALDANIHQLARQLPIQHLQPGETRVHIAWVTFWAGLGNAFTAAILLNSIFTFGEEFGWRGYLLPRLAPLGGVTAAVVVGVVWGLWHAPIILLDGYNFPGYPIPGVAAMILFTVPLSIILAWLRLESRSVWPGVLLHAAINAQAGVVLLLLSHGNSLLRPPVGLLGTVPFWILAVWLIQTRRLDAPEWRREPVAGAEPVVPSRES
jgi:membrane protease YdiL (CAAX protease family)